MQSICQGLAVPPCERVIIFKQLPKLRIIGLWRWHDALNGEKRDIPTAEAPGSLGGGSVYWFIRQGLGTWSDRLGAISQGKQKQANIRI